MPSQPPSAHAIRAAVETLWEALATLPADSVVGPGLHLYRRDWQQVPGYACLSNLVNYPAVYSFDEIAMILSGGHTLLTPGDAEYASWLSVSGSPKAQTAASSYTIPITGFTGQRLTTTGGF